MNRVAFQVALVFGLLWYGPAISQEHRANRAGTLHLIAVGVDRYPGLAKTCRAPDGSHTGSCDLQYAGADATLFVRTMKDVLGSEHSETRVVLLVNGGKDGEPTKANIIAAFQTLRVSEPEDTVVVFLAGHGERGDHREYYFLPTDAERHGPGRGNNLIDASEIERPINRAKGRRFFFVDACNAGALQQGAEEWFVIFLGAAQAGELAEEVVKDGRGHGTFTRAVAEGMIKEMNKASPSDVYLAKVADYVRKAVARDSDGRQNPVFSSETFRDYVLSK